MRPRVRQATCCLILALACLPIGCGSKEAPSPAADAVIARAEDEEERQALTQARDDIDAEMRRAVAEKEAQSERLRQENEALRKRLEK